MGSLLTLFLVTAAGTFFVFANLMLKLLGHMPAYTLYPLVGATVIAGCGFQAAAFREAQFGLVVVMVLGLEMLLSVLVARAFLGEIYSFANIAGVLLVIAGMGLVHLPADAQAVAVHDSDLFRDVATRKGPRPDPEDATKNR